MSWLLEAAYPIWSTRGLDKVHGGFCERLTLHGEPTNDARRARVQPRQIFAFSRASSLGWKGDARGAAAHGLRYFLGHYRRPDGLFRTLVSPEGKPLDDRAVLYDQAFALLAFAAAAPVVGEEFDLKGEGEKLRLAIATHLKRRSGFECGLPFTAPLLSNPHMHLLEAALAWLDVGGGSQWRSLADELGELALSRLIDSTSGMLHESFDTSWVPTKDMAGRIVEPGHQFEWAYLLLKWGGKERADAREAAYRLIELADNHGVHRGVAINALLNDRSIHDEEARLWPQTERLRAAALAARFSGDARYWKMTSDSAEGLLRYFSTPVRGLWHDRLLPTGDFVHETVTAGNLYHIVGGIQELDALVRYSP